MVVWLIQALLLGISLLPLPVLLHALRHGHEPSDKVAHVLAVALRIRHLLLGL